MSTTTSCHHSMHKVGKNAQLVCIQLTRIVALIDAGGDPSGWAIPAWTLDKDKEFAEKENIAFTFLSITAPGAGILSLEQQPRFCRAANEYAAQIRAANPKQYGFFANIPSLLGPKAACEEIKYSLETLQADGVVLYTRYGKGNHYLGHSDFRAIWDLLDAYKAVVFVHPTHPVDTPLINSSMPQPMIDYPHETTRAAVDLISSGTIQTHKNVKIILSHAGGTLPYLALRPAAMLPYLPKTGDLGSRTKIDITEAFMEDARSFYFDTALSAAPLTLNLLKRFAKPGHVLFGSDYPYAPTPAIQLMNGLLDEYEKRNREFVQSISMGAALNLFPRLASVFGHVERAVL